MTTPRPALRGAATADHKRCRLGENQYRLHSQPVRFNNRSRQSGFLIGDNTPGFIDTL